jgi:hypothetical protein
MHSGRFPKIPFSHTSVTATVVSSLKQTLHKQQVVLTNPVIVCSGPGIVDHLNR